MFNRTIPNLRVSRIRRLHIQHCGSNGAQDHRKTPELEEGFRPAAERHKADADQEAQRNSLKSPTFQAVCTLPRTLGIDFAHL